MTQRTKILIIILAVGVVSAGGWWIWNSQKVPISPLKSELKISVDGNLEIITDIRLPVDKTEAETIVKKFCETKDLNYHYAYGLTEKIGNEWRISITNVNCPCYATVNIETGETNCLKQIPFGTQEITIATDKTEYEHGEIIRITVKNNLNKSIWYIKEICPPSCCALHKLENNEWKSLAVPFPCVQFTYPGGIIEPDKLNPGEKIQKQWDMTLGNKVVESGKYKFSFYYGLTKDDYTKETIYSDEFTIETEKIACSKLDDNQCRNQPSCILLGSSEKAFLETGGEVETFLFEECVDRVPEYANCKEVVKMTQMYGGSQFPKECRCCCGGGTIVRKEAVSGKIKFHCVLARFFSVPPARNASFGRKPPAGGLSLYNDLVYNKRNEREIN